MVSPELYRTAMEELPIVTVDVIFFSTDKTKILLGKRTNEPYAGTFYSFGGRLFKNEPFEGAACRVAKKELGIPLSPADIVFAGVINEVNDSSVFEGVNYHAVTVLFGCTIAEDAFTLDDQHSGVEWFSVADESLHGNVRTRIKYALSAMKQAL